MSRAEKTPKAKPQRELFSLKPNSVADVEKIIKAEFPMETKDLFILEKTIINKNSPNEFERSTFKTNVGEHFKEAYVWIGFDSDGFVLVVAKAQVNIDENQYGDLFDFYKPYLSPTPRFILELDGFLTNQEYRMQKNLYKKMNDYMIKAIVIPIDRVNAHALERKIGDKLLEKNIPILNKYSHRMGK
ncbi:MAG: hypothetical protein Q4A90_04175 [Streptococcus sp.]|nr:hypothetical protein [Streptococcus sp.]